MEKLLEMTQNELDILADEISVELIQNSVDIQDELEEPNNEYATEMLMFLRS